MSKGCDFVRLFLIQLMKSVANPTRHLTCPNATDYQLSKKHLFEVKTAQMALWCLHFHPAIV